MKPLLHFFLVALAGTIIACGEPSSESPGITTYFENRTDRPVWIADINGEDVNTSYCILRLDPGEWLPQIIPYYYLSTEWDVLRNFVRLSLYDDSIHEYEGGEYAHWHEENGKRREVVVYKHKGEGWKDVLRYKFYEYEMSTNESERLAQEVRPDGLWHVEVPTNTRPFHVVRASNLIVITGIMSNYSYTNE